MTDEDAEPTVLDVMTILGSLKTQVTMDEERACLISPAAIMASAQDGQPFSSQGRPTQPSLVIKTH